VLGARGTGMGVTSAESLSRTLLALADPTRRAILHRLAAGDARVTDLSAPFAMSLAAVSKHIRVLEQAGLVRRTVSGREHRLAFDSRPLAPVSEWIVAQRDVWERRLDALESVLLARRAVRRKG
jgi:DNA-binding transcriptional ArsR family regulator